MGMVMAKHVFSKNMGLLCWCEMYDLKNIRPQIKWVFVGYPKETKGYYFYKTSKDKGFVTRIGVFLKKEYISNGASGRCRNLPYNWTTKANR